MNRVYPSRFLMPSGDPNIATCLSCGTLIDVSELEPSALVNCSSCGAQMRVQQEFANFELLPILGEGGQGTMFRALAITVMKREYCADPDFVRRFEREARITASLNNPYIVKVYSYGEYPGFSAWTSYRIPSRPASAHHGRLSCASRERIQAVQLVGDHFPI